jgi:hypothetical protein
MGVGFKIASLGLLLSMVSMALAGEATSVSNPAVYVEVGGGAYYRNLRSDSVVGAENRVSSWDHGRMGWGAGFDAGYRFWKNIAGEAGFFWIQSQKMTFDSAVTYSGTSFARGADINFKSFAGYLAGRANFEIGVDWNIYGKLGLAYIRTHVDYRPISSGMQTGSGSLWSPLLGIGLTYEMSKHWFLGLDYSMFVGNSTNSDPHYANRITGTGVHVPTLQRITANIGYLFEI